MPSAHRNRSPFRSSCGRTSCISARSTTKVSCTARPKKSSEASSSGSWRRTGRSSTPTGARGEASAVALTEKPGERVLGFLWRRRPNIRLHAATDWATRDAPEISHALHTCETLAIRVSEVLSCTGERIAMQWLLSIAGYLLSVVDDREKKANRHELVKASNRARAELVQVEHYYDRAGEKTGRLVYFWGMLIGVVALAVLAVPGVLIYGLFGNYDRGQREDVLHLLRDGRGRRDRQRDDADGVENRRRVRRLRGRATLPSARRELPADHRRRVRGGRLLRPEERPDHVEDVERADGLLLRHDRLHRGVQRAAGRGSSLAEPRGC